MEYYWQLVERSGRITYIPPSKVKQVRDRYDAKQPIHFTTYTVDPHQIVDYSVSDRVFKQDVPAIEAASKAFNEPVYNEEAVRCRWVKKGVTNDKYNRYYSVSPGYHKVGDSNGLVMVAFKKPVHTIDPLQTPYCNADELRQLTKFN